MNIKLKLIMLELLSLLAFSVILIAGSLFLSVEEMNVRIEETLRTAVHGYHGDAFYLKDQGENIDITVFEGDTRIESSIEGAVGTKASEKVIEEVLHGQRTYFDTDININGEEYYGYYMPIESGMLFAGEPKAAVAAFIRNCLLIQIGIGAAAYVVCAVIAAVISSSISKRIHHSAGCLEILADGDLSRQFPEARADSRDETDIIAHAVSALQVQLKEIVTSISSESSQLNDSNNEFTEKFSVLARSVTNINEAVEEIARGSDSQAQETSSASQKIAEMADVIEQNTSNVSNLEHAAEHMSDLSKQTNDTLEDLIAMNETTTANIATVSRQTDATNTSAENIKNAVQVIQTIAEQTNLLSLNASIEAARAGEAGRGFAVVAEEIRKLAEDSSSSADEIEATVQDLLTNSSISVEKMSEVSQDAAEQREKLQNTRRGFEALMEGIQSVYAASKNIYEQTLRLEDQKNTIHNVVQQLAAISEENAATTQKTSVSMQELSSTIESCREETVVLAELSEALNQQTNRFKL